MAQNQETADLDTAIAESAKRINRTIDSMIADLRKVKLDLNRKLRQKPKRQDHHDRPNRSD